MLSFCGSRLQARPLLTAGNFWRCWVVNCVEANWMRLETSWQRKNWIVYSSNAVNKRSEKTMSPVYLQQDSTVLQNVHQTTAHLVCYLHLSRLLNFLTDLPNWAPRGRKIEINEKFNQRENETCVVSGLIWVVSSGLPHLSRAPFVRWHLGRYHYELWLKTLYVWIVK